MKRVSLALLILAFSLPAAAQRGPGLAAHIPFAFEMADKVMPAGDYRVTYSPLSPMVVLIEDQSLQNSAYVLAGLMSPDVKALGETFLAFNRYEDRYFLSRITFLERRCEVLKSKSERVLVTSKIVRTGAVRPVEVKIMAAVR